MKAVIKEIDGINWVCCGRCGHKLCRLMSADQDVKIEIEFKCQSCKKINVFSTEKKGEDYGRK